MTRSDGLREAEASANEHEHELQSTGPTHRADLATGLVGVVVGMAVMAYAMTLPTLGGGRPGPGLFPGIIGGAFVLFGGVLAAQALTRLRRRLDVAVDGTAARTRDAVGREENHCSEPRTIDVPGKRLAANAAVVVLAIVGYILLAEVLGFLITLFLVTFAIMLSLRSKLLSSAVAAVVIPLLMWLVFEELLRVQLPDGLLV